MFERYILNPLKNISDKLFPEEQQKIDSLKRLDDHIIDATEETIRHHEVTKIKQSILIEQQANLKAKAEKSDQTLVALLKELQISPEELEVLLKGNANQSGEPDQTQLEIAAAFAGLEQESEIAEYEQERLIADINNQRKQIIKS